MSDIDVHEIRDFMTSAGLLDDSGQIDDDESLFEADILDSLRLIAVVSELESTYGIKIKSIDLIPSNFDSLNGIARLVNRRASVTRP